MFKKILWFSVFGVMLLFPTAIREYTVHDDGISPAVEETTGKGAIGDPLWCPDGVAPTPNMNGCTDSYPNLQALVLDMANGSIPQPVFNGTIWIEMGTDSSLGNIIIDGNVLPPNWAFTNLTLQGGWDGINGSTATPGKTGFARYIHILNWKGDVTVNDLRIDGTSSTGLKVMTAGKINIDNVASSDNFGYGAYLDNYQSWWAAKAVTLTGSNVFENNAKTGLYIKSYGVISSENLAANSNGGAGVYLANIWGDIDVGANLNGINVFRSNQGSGLFAETSGEIYARDITAVGNGEHGAVLKNLWSTSPANVTVEGKNNFEGNMFFGFGVNATGKTTVSNITSRGNGIYGVSLGSGDGVEVNVATVERNACGGLQVNSTGPIKVWLITVNGNGFSPIEDDVCIQGSGVYLDNSSPQANNSGIDISVASINNNNPNGLHAISRGDITLKSVGANNNGFLTAGNGALLDNCISNGKECEGSGVMTLNNAGFSDNFLNGLFALSNQDITISNSVAERNGEDGFSLENNSNINVYCSQLIDNKAYGIDAILPGVLNLFNVFFSGNVLGDTNISGGGTIQLKEYKCNDK